MYALLIKALIAVALIILFLRLIRDTRCGKHITLALSVLYLVVIVYCTLIGRTAVSISAFKFSTPFLKAVMKRHYGRVANRSLLNLLLFVPLGYLAVSAARFLEGKPMHIEKEHMLKGLALTALTGLAVSLLIETIQLVFSLGVFDGDDLIKNTLGAALGFIIYYKLNKRKTQTD